MNNNEGIEIITTCRSCGSDKLVSVFSLGELAVSNFLDQSSSESFSAPIELLFCENCSLVQLKHSVSPEKLYRKYWYKSGVNRTMQEELAAIASQASWLAKPKSGDFVLDIGSNDSTLLLSYKLDGLKLVGFEPARNLMPFARVKNINIINDFFNYEAWRKEFGQGKAKIITAIAMFYDLNDPNKFVADVRNCLDKDGVFIIQMSYLPSMLSQNAYDNCCHEHVEYYSLSSLENLLARHQLEVFDVALNDVNGGSFRIYIQHKGGLRKATERLVNQRGFEKSINLSDRKVYDDFSARINSLKEKLYSFIKSEVDKGKTVYVYGAATKGNTLLQFCNLKYPLIRAAADRNPAKWGKRTVATLIPIISEEQARREGPDYFLILPWHFLKEFIEREEKYLKRGGKLIVPLPQFRIVSYGDSI